MMYKCMRHQKKNLNKYSINYFPIWSLCLDAVCGRIDIEGEILCNKFNLRIIVKINDKDDVVYGSMQENCKTIFVVRKDMVHYEICNVNTSKMCRKISYGSSLSVCESMDRKTELSGIQAYKICINIVS